jgi:hypothetical protein
VIEHPVSRRPWVWMALAVAVMATAVAIWGRSITSSGRSGAQTARQAEVAARGSTVMPFDLKKTTHVFTDLVDGGVQTVTANDAGDDAQIVLVRAHLQDEEAKFRAGDFSDPEAIHGPSMPGLAALKAAAGGVEVRYEAVPGGARLWYSTSDSGLVDALHSWFAAQSSDHGSPLHGG